MKKELRVERASNNQSKSNFVDTAKEDHINKDQSFLYVKLLTGRADTENIYTAIRTSSSKKSDVRVLVGTIEKNHDELLELNRAGFNIFMAVNEIVGERKNQNVTRIRAVFYDNDNTSEVETSLEPTFKVKSGRGDHGYYVLSDNMPVREFRDIQESISRLYKTDPSIKDPARLMRLPGFAHVKDRGNPKPVTIFEVSEKKYEFNTVKDHFLKSTQSSVAKVNSDIPTQVSESKFLKWTKQLPTSEGAANPYGGRNSTALILVREGLALKIEKITIQAALCGYCDRSGLDKKEIESMIDRQQISHADSNFAPYFLNDKSKRPSSAALADMFVRYKSLIRDDNPLVRYWRGEFYLYTGTKYELFKINDLRSEVVAFFNSSSDLRDKYRPSWVEEVITHLMGLGHLSPNIEIGSDILDPKLKRNLVFLNNCILHLNDKKNWNIEKINHDPRYFSQITLPYDYDSKAKCDLFLRILHKILPDRESRDFLQEWFGYNLIHDTGQGKFVVLLGDGANGKTVILSALTALIGRQNVSAVPLENFTAVRTFPLAVTMGKLSNIVDEMGNLKGVESTLKQFVSGSIMNVERKGKDGVEQKPTARLTFATNTLPNFIDRSDGLWRRLVIIPMTIQILDESKQDKRLSRLEFWEQSGELPGILNWSLEGLKGLMKRGHFVEPTRVAKFKDNIRFEADHLSAFFEEYLTVNNAGQIGATTLYLEYQSYAKNNGNLPVSQMIFASAIRKYFPSALKSDQPKATRNKKRERVWTGIALNAANGGAY